MTSLRQLDIRPVQMAHRNGPGRRDGHDTILARMHDKDRDIDLLQGRGEPATATQHAVDRSGRYRVSAVDVTEVLGSRRPQAQQLAGTFDHRLRGASRIGKDALDIPPHGDLARVLAVAAARQALDHPGRRGPGVFPGEAGTGLGR